ncbi:hypothetical protein WICPIJ_000003 [Wickerhamomyces pijperi]|uniref:Uncharacterized protein n=1 Tax=Wickerhamomyces pijperi TaxID=599730 RepID=A0A9P8QIN2_WICPI|nr:hypothetical protein WICPIJ_000003 [Wickerhamomyces pijperi]
MIKMRRMLSRIDNPTKLTGEDNKLAMATRNPRSDGVDQKIDVLFADVDRGTVVNQNFSDKADLGCIVCGVESLQAYGGQSVEININKRRTGVFID